MINGFKYGQKLGYLYLVYHFTLPLTINITEKSNKKLFFNT